MLLNKKREDFLKFLLTFLQVSMLEGPLIYALEIFFYSPILNDTWVDEYLFRDQPQTFSLEIKMGNSQITCKPIEFIQSFHVWYPSYRITFLLLFLW